MGFFHALRKTITSLIAADFLTEAWTNPKEVTCPYVSITDMCRDKGNVIQRGIFG